MHRCDCSERASGRRLSTLEVAGVIGMVVIVGVAVAVLVAPHVAAMTFSGALIGGSVGIASQALFGTSS